MMGFLTKDLLLAFPLACIWFGDDMGEYYSDGRFSPRITGPSQGRFVRRRMDIVAVFLLHSRCVGDRILDVRQLYSNARAEQALAADSP